MAKLKRTEAPVLFLGLGGTGLDMLRKVKSEFEEHFRDDAGAATRTEYAWIDADTYAIQNLPREAGLGEGDVIPIAGDYAALAHLVHDTPYARPWLDPGLNVDILDPNHAMGCRQVARLMLFASYDQVRVALWEKLNLLAMHHHVGPGRYEPICVQVMAGLCGGTGSGLLLDVAYLLRNIARLAGFSIRVEACLTLPEVTLNHRRPDPAHARQLCLNGYACLKELDFWMNAEENGASMIQQYTDYESVPWSGAPFESVCLLSSVNERDNLVYDSYRRGIDAFARYMVRFYQDTGDYPGGISFLSARSNQAAVERMMPHPYPLSTRYHALGVYTSEAEERLTVAREWAMLLGEVLPRLQSARALADERAKRAFREDVLSLDRLNTQAASVEVFRGYEARHPIPDLGEIDLEVLRHREPDAAPHGQAYRTYLAALREARPVEERELGRHLTAAFLSRARMIATDLERGPGHLAELLSPGAESLDGAFPEVMAAIRNTREAIAAGMNGMGERCGAAFQRLQQMTMVERMFHAREIYERYMIEATRLYDAGQTMAYLEALQGALDDFRRAVAAFSAMLWDLIHDAERRWDACREELDRATYPDVGLLFDPEALNQELSSRLPNQAVKDTLTRDVYDAIFRCADRLWSAEAVRPEEISRALDAALDPLRERLFSGVHDAPLTAKLMNNRHFPAGLALANWVASSLCPGAAEASRVLFNPIPEALGLPEPLASRLCVISVPRKAVELAQGVGDFCHANWLPASVRTTEEDDALCWIDDKASLALYLYGGLERLRGEYLAGREGGAVGYHLYMKDNPDARDDSGCPDALRQHWAQALPEPFIRREAREAGEVARLLREAEEQGLLSLEYTFLNGMPPRAEVYACLYAPEAGRTFSPERFDAALEAIASDLGAPEALEGLGPAAAGERLRRLRACRDALIELDGRRGRERLRFTCLDDQVARAWGEMLGLSDSLVLPRPDLTPEGEEALERAWRTAYGRAVREALGRRPQVVARLREHTACRQKLAERLGKAEALIARLEAAAPDPRG